nr:hypothetical protein [Tanacetum cinerariifolium]
ALQDCVNQKLPLGREESFVKSDAQSIPITTEPSTFKPQKKHKPKRKHTQEYEVPPIESPAEQNLPLPSNDLLPSVKAAKLMTEVVITAGATKVCVLRKRRGVIIQDLKETTTTATMQLKVQEKDKGKAILIEEPKPLKRQA